MFSQYYKVNKVSGPMDIKVKVPGSKSITNRALLLSCLSKGTSILKNVLFSDDSRHFIDCVSKLSYEITVNEQEQTVIIKGGKPKTDTEINVGSAGTAARFITALLASYEGVYSINASKQMQARPMQPLFEALINLGAEIEYLSREYHLPIRMKGGILKGGKVSLDATRSSQFLSALLMTGCLHDKELNIIPFGKETSMSYIDITLNMIKQFNGNAKRSIDGSYIVPSGNTYKAQEYMIEPDVSAACYFYAMAFLTGGTAVVEGVHKDSMQGDIKFISLLEMMGAEVIDTPLGISLKGPKGGVYDGIDINMNDFSDQTMTLAALSVYAKTPTRIRGIEHIKYQETNRISAVINELRKIGADASETEDGIIIYPCVPKAALIETYDDHRMAMAFSLIGLRADGIEIYNPMCTTKTFENYFDIFSELTM